MCLAQGPQRSDVGDARTRCPSVSSQALYHWAIAVPILCVILTWVGNDRDGGMIEMVVGRGVGCASPKSKSD